ncbi:MAG: bifunctional diguanylate cyclase/phosphodiesterase [Erysipelothrix sp.]|jgi:diguanylate cyclase (GGDEF)-like protein|nr:bifunctional diguanylate cyclase/phosphodiesterase [Erysipelothrix sp.]
MNIKIIDKRTLIVPILVSIIIFIFLGQIVYIGIRDHFYDRVRELSIHLAKGYSYSIQNSINSEFLFEQLIEDKLLLASETTAIYTQIEDRSSLVLYAQSLRVDEINLYNPQGVLVLSTMPEGTQWQTFEGHPIYDFILRPDRTMIENIRANYVTGIEYKYGYYKLENGNIIQIGLLASKINELIGVLTTDHALKDILDSNSSIALACYAQPEQNELSCLGDDLGVNNYENLIKENYINQSEVIGLVSTVDSSLYELYVPIMIDQNNVGTLILYHEMDEQNEALVQLLYVGFSVLAIMYFLLAYAYIVHFNKNKQLSEVAYIDDLTQLPNDLYLQKTFEQFKEKTDQEKSLIMLNIDEFRTINVTYGYHHGNQILVETANRLKKVLEHSQTLFRWEGDRFVFLIESDHQTDQFEFANKILQQFKQAFDIDDIKKVIRVKLGIVPLEKSISSLQQAIQKAMITLEYERLVDKDIFVFNEDIASAMIRETNIVKELQDIIEGNNQERLSLVFQPQLDLKTNKITGLEALSRLNSDQYGSINPAEFIDIAEKHYLIYDLGKVVFNKAITTINELISLGYKDIRVAVNVSGIQLLHDQFVNDLLILLKKYKLSGKHIEIEITESILMNDMQRINRTLEQLRAHEISISIDDFGTGYSSFFTISELHVDSIKINRSFVRQIYTQMDEQKMIAREIIQLAHKLGLRIVAEEVEHDKEYQYLLKHQCDCIQGYYFCRPLQSHDLYKFLGNR